MSTVFSHIIQKRFSQFNEDVATDALAYVLETSDAARNGMTKLLRGIVPDLPALRFKTQQTEGSIRPDMWGFAESDVHVFVENKFWAGLTDNQPISYLKQLATYSQPTVLLVIAPDTREQMLWRELSRRLVDAGISFSARDAVPGIVRSVTTQLGPVLALTSWTTVLSLLEHATVGDVGARGDLVQLRALCDAADIDAFAPFSLAELSDQRTPAFVLQLSGIVQTAVDLANIENVLDIKRLNPQASWDRIGRYVRVGGDRGPGAWFGVHFGLWKSHGGTPLWLVFQDTDFGRARDVWRLIEPWAANNNVLAVLVNGSAAIAIDIPASEDKAGVVRHLVKDLTTIASALSELQSSDGTQSPPE